MPLNPAAYNNTLNGINTLDRMSFKVKALIYGNPGAGKTIMGANSPAPLELDADGTGALSLFNHHELAMSTKVLQIRSYNQMLDVFEGIKIGDPRVADRQTVMIDTLSQLTKKHLDEFIAKETIAHPNRDPVAYQRDYKFNTEAMRQLIGYFIELDINLVVLCHAEDHREDLPGGATIFTRRPFLTPRLLSSMEAVFDVFGYMESQTNPQDGTVVRTLQIMPDRRTIAKSRIGGLPPVILNPTFQNLVDAKELMVNKFLAYKAAVEAAQAQQVAPPPVPEGVILPSEHIPSGTSTAHLPDTLPPPAVPAPQLGTVGKTFVPNK